VLRRSRCSVLAVRDTDESPERRQKRLERVALLRSDALKMAASGDLDAAERLLRMAAALQPGMAAIEEELAGVLEKAGRKDEAERYRILAGILRHAHA
jgi:Flp pilus assembly protein TadD